MLRNWPAAQKGCASRSSELCWKTFPNTLTASSQLTGWSTALTQPVLFHGAELSPALCLPTGPGKGKTGYPQSSHKPGVGQHWVLVSSPRLWPAVWNLGQGFAARPGHPDCDFIRSSPSTGQEGEELQNSTGPDSLATSQLSSLLNAFSSTSSRYPSSAWGAENPLGSLHLLQRGSHPHLGTAGASSRTHPQDHSKSIHDSQDSYSASLLSNTEQEG